MVTWIGPIDTLEHLMRIPLQRLSIAHEALAVIAGIGLVVLLAVVWDDPADMNIGRVRSASELLVFASALYLFATSWIEFRAADAQRASYRSDGAAWLHLAVLHALVLFSATISLMRGASSRAFLAGLHQPMAALGTVACLGLALAVITFLAGRGLESEPPPSPAPRRFPWEVWIPWALHTASAIAVAALILHLERLPMPHGRL